MAMLGQLGGLASLAGGGGAASMLGLKNPDDLYIGLLQSESVMDGIVQRFDLMRLYKAKKLSDARNVLTSNTKITSEKSSLISISVKDHDAKRAAAMANAYVSGLHDLLLHLAVTSAAQRRMFFEQQVEEVKSKLTDAEVALEKTEMKTGIILPEGQAAAVISTIMQLQAKISASEVELGALRTSATDQNPEVITLQSQITALRGQLANFEKGHPGVAAIEGKVDEAREGQVIQVVDPALVPDRRSWPLRTLLTLLAFILGVMFSSFWALLQSSYGHAMQDPETATKIRQLRRLLRLRRNRI